MAQPLLYPDSAMRVPVPRLTVCTLLGLLSLLGVLCLDPRVAGADDTSRLSAQALRLREQLDRTNAEIAAIKRGSRSVGDEYRLRQKMSDAEALARQLTQSEAALPAARSAGSPRPPEPMGPDMLADPHDGPFELEAKAGLLADQARRLSAEADSLTRDAS